MVKTVVTLRCHEFKCGCGEVHNIYMERDPKPECPPCPESTDPEYKQKIVDYYQRLGQRGGFTQIDPKEFGFVLKDGMRLRVTLEEIGPGEVVSIEDKLAAWEPVVKVVLEALVAGTKMDVGYLTELAENIPEDKRPT
jgi:hypothetical protein